MVGLDNKYVSQRAHGWSMVGPGMLSVPNVGKVGSLAAGLLDLILKRYLKLETIFQVCDFRRFYRSIYVLTVFSLPTCNIQVFHWSS